VHVVNFNIMVRAHKTFNLSTVSLQIEQLEEKISIFFLCP